MKKLTGRQQLAKQYVLKDFDFEKVSKAMRLFDWTWNEKGIPYYPTAEQIKKTASDLIDLLFEDNCASVQTGGLTVSLKNEEGNKCLVIEFVLENGQGGRYL